VIVAGMASKENERISFAKFLMFGVPVMLVSVCIATIYFYYKYHM